MLHNQPSPCGPSERERMAHMLNRAVNRQQHETCIALITKWYKLGYILHEIKPTETEWNCDGLVSGPFNSELPNNRERESEVDVSFLSVCCFVHGVRGQQFNDLDGLSKWTHSNARFSPKRRTRTTSVIYFERYLCLLLVVAMPGAVSLAFKINWKSY